MSVPEISARRARLRMAVGRQAVLILGVFLALAPAARAAGPTFQLSAGVDYSSGKYGAPGTTDAIIEPIRAKLAYGDWTFRAVVPYASIRSPSDVIVVVDDAGGEQIDSIAEEQIEPSQSGHPKFRSGISDISFSATHSFSRIGGSPLYWDTTARIRLPTGDRHAGLGTGVTDVFLDSEAGADWREGGLSVDIGRRFLGDLPHLTRHDGWQGSASGWVNPTSKLQFGVSYDWHESAIRGIQSYQLIGGYASYRINRNFKLQLDSGTGLSRSSPSFDVGLTLIYRPFGRPR